MQKDRKNIAKSHVFGEKERKHTPLPTQTLSCPHSEMIWDRRFHGYIIGTRWLPPISGNRDGVGVKFFNLKIFWVILAKF